MSDDVAAFGFYALPPAAERLRRLSAGLGPGPLARRARSALRRLASLGRPGPFDVEPFPGQRARLYPAENLSDKRVFAGAQAWDAAERAALAQALRAAPRPAVFVDAGANAGLYTLAVRAEAGPGLRVLAIEPDAENLRRLRFNLRASGAEADVMVAPVALSDREGVIRIATDHANRGELSESPDGAPVATRPLLDLVREAGFSRVDALKIDIEGLEEQVLSHYFAHAPRALWPRCVVLEARNGEDTPALARLRTLGYGIAVRTRLNAVLEAPADWPAVSGDTGDADGDEA